ncbi:hypothetical protein [Brevundimonas sp.]|uniref:hypothetical protein n=1 Tax=Brevundimonas sp. TaxID=1871086 RepID=UPI002D43CD2C|nr:hypothetical protein [Brevundimonas sp.]HYD28639.1 hypothetical protein [Brevundimonas sp.]
MILALTASLALAGQAAPPAQASEEQQVQAAADFGQVYRNWTVHCSIPGIREMRISFDVELDANGAIVGQPVLVRPRNTPAYQAAAHGARQALLASAPFDVPEGYQGGRYRPTFLPGRVCPEADED